MDPCSAIKASRVFPCALAAWCALLAASGLAAELRLATFSVDVTPPLGHGMMGGLWQARSVADPLEAHGVVWWGEAAPVVFVSVDWCEIRNDALRQWQEALAAAVGSERQRVLVTCVHQHDAPVADLAAEQLLRERGLEGSICDPQWHAQCVARVAQAARDAMQEPNVWTHVGTGQARVERVASNRRYVLADGTVRFDRGSRTTGLEAIAADEGVVDPWLKTLSFWHDDEPLCAISFYAVHPMSYYGQGDVSADFPGLARRRRQADLPAVRQIYASGCSGNVTAGKYNDGAPSNRGALAARLHEAMEQAWQQTSRHAVGQMPFRCVEFRLKPRDEPGFFGEDLAQQLAAESAPFDQCLAAMGLSWRNRIDAGRALELPVVEFGPATLTVLPGEAYVEFQLAAQQLRPDRFVCVAGYGECATGYIPTEQHRREGDGNLRDWCWVAPGSEPRLLAAMAAALEAPSPTAPAVPATPPDSP